MFDLFSDIFARRDNVLTRVDARAKVIIAVLLIITVISSHRLVLPLAVFTGCLATMCAVRIPPRLVMLRLAGPLGMVTVLVVLQTFLTEGAELFALHVFGRELVATSEGLSLGCMMGSRVLGSVSVVLLLGSVTPAYKVFHALRWFGVPQGWVEVALLVYRYTFALLEQAADVFAAQSVRLGYSSLRRSITSMGILVGTVLTQSMDQAMRTYDAMVLRGYQGSFPFGPLPRMGRKDVACIAVAILTILPCYLIVEW
jgi:cobalt/nickel transport system permease protein